MFDTIIVDKNAPLSFHLIDTTKKNPLKNLRLEMTWNAGRKNADIDLIAVLLQGPDARVKALTDLVCYVPGHTKQPGIEVIDARTADEVEYMHIGLDQLPSTIMGVSLYASIYKGTNGDTPDATFGDYPGSALRIINADTNDVEFVLTLPDFAGADTVQIGTLYYADSWQFETSGEAGMQGAKAIANIGNYHAKNSWAPKA